MSVVVMQGGGGGHTTIGSIGSSGPESHLCLAIIAFIINPPFGRYT